MHVREKVYPLLLEQIVQTVVVVAVSVNEHVPQPPRNNMQTASSYPPSAFEPREVVTYGQTRTALLNPAPVDLVRVQAHLMQGLFESHVAPNENVQISLRQGMTLYDVLQTMPRRQAVPSAHGPRRPGCGPTGLVGGNHAARKFGVCGQQRAEVLMPRVRFGVRGHVVGYGHPEVFGQRFSNHQAMVRETTAGLVVHAISRTVLVSCHSFLRVREPQINDTR
mmetsp:Transcript_31939/g.95638  ORF Transcript_31939/g.95638 Transcript_31939/m.95638 type:complete len:222 (+) Transcript_31939:279-944(+)